LFGLLPVFIRGPILRHFFEAPLPRGRETEVIFKLADSYDELQQALELIGSCYREVNYIEKKSPHSYLTKHNLLPTTLVFVAVHKGRVIGTVSNILDTGLGLPVDSFCDISKYRKTGKRVFEIAGLAIARDWRSSSSNVFLPLVMMSFKYSFENAGGAYMIMTTKSYASYFYQDLFLSKPLMKRAKTYQLASAPKAKTQVLECHDLYERLRKTYRNASHRKSIYQLVTNPIWNVQFPKSKIRLVGRSILDHGKLEEIFKTHADLFKQLGEKVKLLLKSLYKKS
jgi:hypothetical protein